MTAFRTICKTADCLKLLRNLDDCSRFNFLPHICSAKHIFINDCRIAVSAQILFIFQNPLYHVFVPHKIDAIVRNALTTHPICNGKQGTAVQVSLKYILHGFTFRWLWLNFSVPHHVAKWDCSVFHIFYTSLSVNFRPPYRWNSSSFWLITIIFSTRLSNMISLNSVISSMPFSMIEAISLI